MCVFLVETMLRDANVQPGGQLRYNEFVKTLLTPVPDYWHKYSIVIYYVRILLQEKKLTEHVSKVKDVDIMVEKWTKRCFI